MKVERIPLTREQDTLKSYKDEQSAWRDVNKKMTALRDSVKTLYSYDSPFSNKLASSTDENAVTADPGHNAVYGSFKIDVIQPATADRFLSDEIDTDTKVPEGIYIFKTAEKTTTINWKGGSIEDFSNAINKRGGETMKSSVIGASHGKKTVLIESLKTGKENNLVFEQDAKNFAKSIGMISPIKSQETILGTKQDELHPAPPNKSIIEQQELPLLETAKIADNNSIILSPRSGFSISIPEQVGNDTSARITFTITGTKTDDIIEKNNNTVKTVQASDTESTSTVKDITGSTVESNQSVSTEPESPASLEPVTTSEAVYAVMGDSSEKLITTPDILSGEKTEISLDVKDYPGIKSIAVRNRNTGTTFLMSSLTVSNPSESGKFQPLHPVSTADDAIIRYEGITIHRPSNKIDDIIPDITLNIHEKSDKTATITVKPDVESSKQALITFVGKYNQTVAELNILSQTKPELVDELDYLSDDEKKAEKDKLGMFLGDFTLTSLKSNMQTTVSAQYSFADNATVTMLSQLGISTSASGYGSSYSENKLRGYLEIDEKKLDSTLADNIDNVKKLFGYDSNGDLIIDTGIGYQLDKQLTAYTQTNGIISLRTGSLDGKIKNSESKIAKLETQLDEKEQQLREQYSKMEGSLNSLENQQNTISNFTKQNNSQ